ncbi:DUF6230 family protein [Camelliibacillus cellulosilyticus]|uniref:DUF6230 family protein n=1 Tax=Camelliibacillus cellulosilyticus TaxID=2174486 RepID=A0ABV9GLF8_9BACL
MTETVSIHGRTVKKRFWIALIAGFLFLGALLTVFGVSGTAYAIPLSGVGSFTVQFDKLVGEDFKLYGGLSESGNSKTTPVAVNDIKHATVYGLHIYKDIDIPGMGTLRVNIKSSNPVEINGLIQKANLINGDAVFDSLLVKDNYVGDIKDPMEKVSKEFTQESNKITLKNGNLSTVYLFQKTVSLPGMKVYFEKIK